MLTTDFDNFGKGQHLKAILESMLGNGVFNSDGEIWKSEMILVLSVESVSQVDFVIADFTELLLGLSSQKTG